MEKPKKMFIVWDYWDNEPVAIVYKSALSVYIKTKNDVIIISKEKELEEFAAFILECLQEIKNYKPSKGE